MQLVVLNPVPKIPKKQEKITKKDFKQINPINYKLFLQEKYCKLFVLLLLLGRKDKIANIV